MKIAIDKIKPSPNPVRKTWDEDKMNALVQSIKEQGLIVPIKVRPNGEGYEIVYGHRRTEACKQAGFTEIEAEVDSALDDTQAYLEAVLENLNRDDLERSDEIVAVQTIQKLKGWSLREIARRGFWDRRQLDRLSEYGKMPDHIKNLVGINTDRSDDKPLTLGHIEMARRAGDHGRRTKILEKSAAENLSINQTKQLAEAVREAPTPQAKKKLLDWKYSSTIHDPEYIRHRKETHGPRDPIYREHKPKATLAWDSTPEIKMLIDAMSMAIKTFIDLTAQIQSVANIGKLAPEGKQFMAHKLRGFRKKIDQLIAELEDSSE